MSWIGLEDERFKQIIEDAADEMASDLSMSLDEGRWAEKFYNRCDQLGYDTPEAVRLRGFAENIIRLRLTRVLLGEIDLGTGE